MTTKRSFKSLIDQAKKRDSYWVGKAIHDFTEELVALMELRGVNKSELERRIDTSPAYVTKVLRGDTNFTISPQNQSTTPYEDEYHEIFENKVKTKSPWKKQGSYEPYTTTA